MANRIYGHPLGWNCESPAEKALQHSRERKMRSTRLARDVRVADFLVGTPDCHSSHIERIHPGKAHLPA